MSTFSRNVTIRYRAILAIRGTRTQRNIKVVIVAIVVPWTIICIISEHFWDSVPDLKHSKLSSSIVEFKKNNFGERSEEDWFSFELAVSVADTKWGLHWLRTNQH